MRFLKERIALRLIATYMNSRYCRTWKQAKRLARFISWLTEEQRQENYANAKRDGWDG
jgi:hypothetical protein